MAIHFDVAGEFVMVFFNSRSEVVIRGSIPIRSAIEIRAIDASLGLDGEAGALNTESSPYLVGICEFLVQAVPLFDGLLESLEYVV